MYPIPTALDATQRRNDGLRTYSRLEYATPDGTWLLVAAGALARRPRPPRPRLRALFRRLAGTAAPAAHAEPVSEG